MRPSMSFIARLVGAGNRLRGGPSNGSLSPLLLVVKTDHVRAT